MIVIGSDLSRGSDAAARLGLAWSRRDAFGPVLLVHALEGPAQALPTASRERIITDLEAQARQAASGDGSRPCDIALRDGDAIEALARDADALVVVGSEGGSATLLRRAGHVPAALATRAREGLRLLVAPPGWLPRGPMRPRDASRRRQPALRLERVLVACALDGSDEPRVALACEIAARSERAEIHLAHVVDTSAVRHHPASVRAVVRDDTDDAVRDADDRLRDLATESIPLELAARRDPRLHVVRQGPVERDLAGLAASQAIDLVVAGGGAVSARLAGFTPAPLLVLG